MYEYNLYEEFQMAAISAAGKVTGKQGEPAVTVREFGSGGKIAKFSIVDQEYYYSKDDDKLGQFYSVEVTGKAADIVADRLNRGDRVAVHGQIVQRKYQDRIYLDIKNARVTFQEDRRDSSPESPF
jgi:single-stranded DNA-binding protein